MLPTSWNLPHYFYDSLTDANIDADIATWLPITREYAERYKWRIRAFTTPEEVLEYYEYGEAFDMVGKKTMHYLSYLSALDTQDTEVQKKLGELEYLGIQLSELTLFVSQEWKELGADKIRAFAESPLLAAYRNDLIETANNVQYILDEKVEQALNKKSRALGIFGLHEELRSSFEFPWTEPVIPTEVGIQVNEKSENKEVSSDLDSVFQRNEGNNTRIIFIRHVESKTNAAGIVTWDTLDIWLSDEGKRQITELWKILEGINIDALYCSPKKRCHDTITQIAQDRNKEIITDNRIIERVKWDLSGRENTDPEVKAELKKAWADWSYRPMNTGETFWEVLERAWSALHEIVSQNIGKTVVICSHYPVIGVLIGKLTDWKMYSNIYNGKPIFVDISEKSDGDMQGKIIHNSANTERNIGLDSTLPTGQAGSRSQAHLAGMTETKMLTEEEIRAFAKNPNRDIRRRAAESMNSVYLVHQNQITLGNLYTGIVKNWSSSMELRGYQTAMSKRNISEQVPDNVVDRLMTEVQKYYPLYQRFLRAKQQHLGLPELYGYDVHAPIFKIEKKIPYEEACKTVIEMFEGFDSRFWSYARDMLEAARVDAFPKAGKRGGAFASYDKWIESFVLLNYTDTVDDSFTLAHELGHAIHGHLAQVQKSPVYDAPLVLAETASIFSESLLMEKIQATLSPEEKLELLNQKLLDVFGSIHRQIMYVSFERRVHEHIHGGGEMTYRELNLWWNEESQKLAGDVVTPILPPEKNYTWSAIPHIFSTPFYCYAYSFGMLVSLALVEKYKREWTAMIDDYVKLLSSGGSVPPVEILQSIGIDVTKPEFYSDAFATIESWLVSFEETQMKND